VARGIREDLVAQACLEAYGLVRHEQWLADRALDAVLRAKTALYANERRAVAERVYALLRRQRLIDHILPKVFPELSKLSKTHADLVRFAADRVLGGENASKVTDALQLQGEFAARLAKLNDPALTKGLDTAQQFAMSASVPDALAKRLVADLGPERAAAEAEAFNVRAPLTIRANTLKTTRENLAARLDAIGVKVTTPAHAPSALTLTTRINVFSLAPFKEGLFEVQDEGSQLLGQLVDAPGGRVIDACAGAGGKTLQLAAQMKNKGDLFALDVDGKRLGELKARAKRAGVHNVRITTLPRTSAEADQAVKQFEGTADRVLIDAPCTGTGTLRRKPDARYRFDDALLGDHTKRQSELLGRFAKLVKRGGRVVYGTCSLLAAEDEEIVTSFLANNKDFKVRPVTEWVPAVCAQGPYLRLFSSVHGTDGFFGAVLERT
jgi:16S rRNA (cytosine967-C5)-methyltransferase